MQGMNYRFENTYTQAERIKWQMQAASNLGGSGVSFPSICCVFVIQFCLWAPILYFLPLLNMPFVLVAISLFMSFFFIGMIYDSLILPHVSARFDKKIQQRALEKSHAIIDIDDEEIRTREGEQEIIFKWTGIRNVEDDEKTVFLLTERGYCSIPARCFPGFLEKDAFVRACREKISGQTEQGTHFA